MTNLKITFARLNCRARARARTRNPNCQVLDHENDYDYEHEHRFAEHEWTTLIFILCCPGEKAGVGD